MTLALIILALMFLILALGVPVAFAMLLAGGVGIYSMIGLGPASGVYQTSVYEHVASFTFATIPMFILMSEFLTAGKFTSDMFKAANKWMGHLKGGVTYAAVAGSVMLAAISGSSTAAASSLASASFPEMQKLKYDEGFSAAALAVVGTLAMMIPPSIGLVVFGLYTETSIGHLLVAGFVPGVITAIGFIVTIYFSVRHKPEIAPVLEYKPTRREKIGSLKSFWPILILMLFMFLAIYSGIITPSEVGAVGALLALIIGVAMRRMGPAEIVQAFIRATRHSAAILMIVGCASVLGIFLAFTGVANDLIGLVEAANLNRWVVLCLTLSIVVMLGFFLDQMAIVAISLPVLFPIIVGLDFDPVHYGILFIKTAEIGLITPPMGLNIFVVSGVTKVPSRKIFKAVWPFVAIELVVLGLLIVFPQLSLWLPSLVYS